MDYTASMNFQEAIAVAQRELRINLSYSAPLDTLAELNDAMTALARLDGELNLARIRAAIPPSAELHVGIAVATHPVGIVVCVACDMQHSISDPGCSLTRDEEPPDNEIDVPEYGMHPGAVIREYD